jgi:hypothetical protein
MKAKYPAGYPESGGYPCGRISGKNSIRCIPNIKYPAIRYQYAFLRRQRLKFFKFSIQQHLPVPVLVVFFKSERFEWCLNKEAKNFVNKGVNNLKL